ncbi:P-loop containing nucleoside triphosphate hydrolase protein [Cladorrhinum sp. PSN259]|nr:P-loop containing nucleoside triphosphate hydrolase protein [Cladorrhinum sp. PSN259]
MGSLALAQMASLHPSRDSVRNMAGTASENSYWKSLPELPSPREILAKEPPIPPENPVNSPWASKEAYLTAQYKILRCDAIEGLRNSVRSYIDATQCRPADNILDDDCTCIYTRVRVKGVCLARMGPVFTVEFSVERSPYRILWQQSRRLIPGSIVAITTKQDNFKSICKIATIVQRPFKDGLDQNPPRVDLMFAKPEGAIIDPDLEMIMIESREGYFESARHALMGLQQAAETDSPLDKYLLGVHNEDTPPTFIKENPIMDLSSLDHRNGSSNPPIEGLDHHDVIIGGVPKIEGATLLDESQLQAIHRSLTTELAIIQGPPGTGKTFVSLEYLKALVAHRRNQNGPPIIVSATTNHALDQLLMRCLGANITNILRLGGRTKSEEIKPHTLYNRSILQRVPTSSTYDQLECERKRCIQAFGDLVQNVFGNRLIDPDALFSTGIITEPQYNSLMDDTMESTAVLNDQGPFGLWLGDNLIKDEILRDRHPIQSELSEAEALKDLPEFEEEEVENIADDEEDQVRIRGERFRFEHVWSGKPPADMPTWHRAVSKALKQQDLFTIQRGLRGAVYHHLRSKLMECTAERVTSLLVQYVDICKNLKRCKISRDTNLVEKQFIDIVGCTTTGLTKYRGFLAELQPRTILIEEAAETREVDIVSALYPSVQQLVLVGDHQQLTPKCSIPWLAGSPFNASVSLFQRMINLKVPFQMLKEQRRMKPELRYILSEFYPQLVDHPVVQSLQNRPDVPGMGGRNCWLFDYAWPEEVNSDCSKFNRQEAQMIVHFFAYLVLNGTPASKITILTYYNGQCKVLLREMRRHPSLVGREKEFIVRTIDSYQGEENDIVLLSLVRSPKEDSAWKVGFLEDEHRAVVAISRARRGFYLFGNIQNVLSAHDVSFHLWAKIWNGFAEQECVQRSRGLPLVCETHKRETWMKDVDDWGDNAGGCNLKCGQTRPCGHPCTLKCHSTRHELLPCGQPCREKLVCGHGCGRNCGQVCICHCREFQEFTAQKQARELSAQKRVPLEERMIQMGAVPSQMLQQSMAMNQSTSRQPNIRSGRHYTTRRMNQTQFSRHPMSIQTRASSGWTQFPDNAEQHDEEMRQERAARAAAAPQASSTKIREVYQPTSLVNGQRVDNGQRITQQVQHGVATEPAAGPVPDLSPSSELASIPALIPALTPALAPAPVPTSMPISAPHEDVNFEGDSLIVL